MLVLAALVLVTGCRVQLTTTLTVEDDGSGTLTQAVGFDDAALARVGDLSQQLAVDDLRAAGWTVDDPVREGDTTWVRAHHDFDDADEANVLLAQLSGPDGPYREMVVTRTSSLISTSTEVRGTVDLSAGIAMFGDDQLTALLGPDGSAGLVPRIEQEEGRPAEEMVEVTFVAELPGTTESVGGVLGSPPQPVDVSSSQNHLLSLFGKVVLAALVVLTALVIGLRVRVRRRRRRRMMRSNLPRR